MTSRVCGGRVFAPPLLVGIEPTNRCNLSCRMCARQHWDEQANPQGDMPYELFRRAILPFLASGQTVNLQCLGEPLLSGSLFEMARACAQRGCRVVFTTNGTLLGRFSRDIVDSGIAEVTVSLDGIGAHAQMRGIPAGIALEGVRALTAEGKARARPPHRPPACAVNFVAMRDNVGQLTDVIEAAAEAGARKVTVMHAVVHERAMSGQRVLADPAPARAVFSRAADTARRLGVRLELPSLEPRIRMCRQPLERIYVNWNGDVRPCCSSTLNERGALKAGNVRDTPLDAIWNGGFMRRLRMSLAHERNMPDFCARCCMRASTAENYLRLLP